MEESHCYYVCRKKIRTCLHGQRYELFHVSVENRGVVGKEGMMVVFCKVSREIVHTRP